MWVDDESCEHAGTQAVSDARLLHTSWSQIARQQRQRRLTSIQSRSVVVIIKIARCVIYRQVLRGVVMVTEDWSPISGGNFVSLRARAVRSVRFINSGLRATAQCGQMSPRLASLKRPPRVHDSGSPATTTNNPRYMPYNGPDTCLYF